MSSQEINAQSIVSEEQQKNESENLLKYFPNLKPKLTDTEDQAIQKAHDHNKQSIDENNRFFNLELGQQTIVEYDPKIKFQENQKQPRDPKKQPYTEYLIEFFDHMNGTKKIYNCLPNRAKIIFDLIYGTDKTKGESLLHVACIPKVNSKGEVMFSENGTPYKDYVFTPYSVFLDRQTRMKK